MSWVRPPHWPGFYPAPSRAIAKIRDSISIGRKATDIHVTNGYNELELIVLPKHLVPPGLEPGTFRVLSERDNHYTMELYNFENYCSYDSLIRYMNYFL